MKILWRKFDQWKETQLFVSMDETTDAGRSVANVIVDTLKEIRPGQIFLLTMEALHKVNHS